MRSTTKLTLAAGIALVFGATVLILLRFMPAMHKPADYLVVGALATLLCILIAFVAFLSGSANRSSMFYKRRK